MLHAPTPRHDRDAQPPSRPIGADGRATIAYAAPAAALAGFVTGYQLYVAPPGPPRDEWLLPGVGNIRVRLGGGGIAVRVGRRRFDPVPDVALTGPTTHAPHATIGGGAATVAIGLTPLGWGRLFSRPAAALADRVAPLADTAGPDLPAALGRVLEGAGDPPAIGRALDRLLAPRLAMPGPGESAVRAVAALLADPSVVTVGQAIARTGLDPVALRRASDRCFGMPPKLLLRRARFLRSFLGYFRNAEADGYAGIEESYCDASHFLRDADRFLGTTPRRFAALATPFLDASLRARAAALGAPACILHPPA